MFACAQPVDGKVHALAGELSVGHVPDFHEVRQSAAGANFEIGEDRMLGAGIQNPELLALGPDTASVDLVLIARAPVMWGGDLQSRAFFRRHAGTKFDPSVTVKIELLEVVHRLLTNGDALSLAGANLKTQPRPRFLKFSL